MASDAIHILVAMCAFLLGGFPTPAHLAVWIHLDGFSDVAARIVGFACRVDRFSGLSDDPFETFFDVAALDQDRFATWNATDLEAGLAKGGAESQKVGGFFAGSRTAGGELGR